MRPNRPDAGLDKNWCSSARADPQSAGAAEVVPRGTGKVSPHRITTVHRRCKMTAMRWGLFKRSTGRESSISWPFGGRNLTLHWGKYAWETSIFGIERLSPHAVWAHPANMRGTTHAVLGPWRSKNRYESRCFLATAGNNSGSIGPMNRIAVLGRQNSRRGCRVRRASPSTPRTRRNEQLVNQQGAGMHEQSRCKKPGISVLKSGYFRDPNLVHSCHRAWYHGVAEFSARSSPC